MDNSRHALYSLDLSELSPDATTASLCPHCGQNNSQIIPRKQAEQRIAQAEFQIDKAKASAAIGKKWLEKAKQKNIRLFIENEELVKEVTDLKEKVAQLEKQVRELSQLLVLAKKQSFQKEKKEESPPAKTSQLPKPTPPDSAEPKQHYFLAKDRSVYVGEMLNGVPHGMGRLFLNVEQIYEGEFHNHRIQGIGTMRNLITNQTYEGQWHRGKRHGKGVTIIGNVRYEGEFREDMAEGWGVGIDLKTGKKYVGAWKKNRFEGEATD